MPILNLMDVSILRSLTWRLGRRLYMFARRDLANNPETNGEYWLLDNLLQQCGHKDAVLIDVGANKGDWIARAMSSCKRLDRSMVIHAFEPTSSTFEALKERSSGWPQIHCHRLALSNQKGQADFFVVDSLAGTNSLHKRPSARIEKVTTDTLDSIVFALGIGSILMVKIDTEGHDLSVLEGARALVESGGADVIQFEYNHSWIANHATLSDVFEFIRGTPYRFGKLFGNGIEIFPEWHPELDRFFECNCLLVRSDSGILRYASASGFAVSNSPREVPLATAGR